MPTIVAADMFQQPFNNQMVESLTIAAGSDLALIVFVGDANTTELSYDGVDLTLVGHTPSTANVDTSVYQMINPPVGTANLLYNSSNAFAEAVLAVYTLSGVDQTTPVRELKGTGDTNMTIPRVTATTSVSGDLLLDAYVLTHSGGTATKGAAQTEDPPQYAKEVDELYGWSNKTASTNDSMEWSQTGGSQHVHTVAVIAPAVSGTIVSATLGATSIVGLDATIIEGTNVTITTEPLANNTGTLLASVGSIIADVYDIPTGDLVVRKTGLTSGVDAVVSFTDALLITATEYDVEIIIGSDIGIQRITTS